MCGHWRLEVEKIMPYTHGASILVEDEATNKVSQACRKLQGQVRDKCNKEKVNRIKGLGVA